MIRLVMFASATVLALGSGCGQDDTIPPPLNVMDGDPTEHERALSERVFDGIEADRVVATVEGGTIVASEVAAWLDLHPDLTVEDAVRDLVDARLAALAAVDLREDANATRMDIVERDARIRGRVLAWYDTTVRASDEVAPPEALVDAWVDEPANTTRYGRPPLARASQVIFRVPQGGADAHAAAGDRARAFARRLSAEPTVDIEALHRLGQAEQTAVSELEDAGFSVAIEAGLIFPEVDSGAPNWPGLQAVVPEFAEAVFGAEPGDLLPAFDTAYGWHVVLVEEFLPGEIPSDDEIRAVAVELLERERAGNVMYDRMAELRGSLELEIAEDDIVLLALTGLERAAAVAERRAATLR